MSELTMIAWQSSGMRAGLGRGRSYKKLGDCAVGRPVLVASRRTVDEWLDESQETTDGWLIQDWRRRRRQGPGS
jgi:hypothetical protein